MPVVGTYNMSIGKCEVLFGTVFLKVGIQIKS